LHLELFGVQVIAFIYRVVCSLQRSSHCAKAKGEVNQRIVWVDLEMSGLDVNRERIIEIAVVVTDAKLTKIVKVDRHCYIEHCLVKLFKSLVCFLDI